MQLNHYVIHKLDKEPNGIASVILSEYLPEVTLYASNLIGALNDRYKSRETYGKFDPALAIDNQQVFPTHFRNYCGDISAENFLSFTTTSMGILQNCIQGVNAATGGYLVFADYSTGHGSFTSIFLVRDASGFLFEKPEGDNAFQVKPQLHIEMEKLAMACKINKERFVDQQGNYLSFIRTNRQSTSNYFIDWIAAKELRMNSEYTDKLCDIIKLIEPLPEIDGQSIDRNELQKKVYDYCTNSVNNKINLEMLGRELYGEGQESKLIDFAHEKGYQIDVEFTPDKNKLKRLYRLNITADNISLKFDYTAINTTVRTEGDTVIITSQRLVDKILREVNASN